MLLLSSTSDAVQLVTSAAATIDVHASWVDSSASAITPGRTNSAITTATTTTVLGSPASGVQRNLKTLHVRNKDAVNSCDVTVRHTDGTTAVELHKVTLRPGYALEYIDEVGFALAQLVPDGGNPGQVLLSKQVVSGTPANITFTGLDGTYDEYLITGFDIAPGTNAVNLTLQVSQDNGATWKTASYQWTIATMLSGSISPSGSASDSSAAVMFSMSNAAANAGSFLARVRGVNLTDHYKQFRFEGAYFHSSGPGMHSTGAASYGGDLNAINAVRFGWSAGNFAKGTFKLYGVP